MAKKLKVVKENDVYLVKLSKDNINIFTDIDIYVLRTIMGIPFHKYISSTTTAFLRMQAEEEGIRFNAASPSYLTDLCEYAVDKQIAYEARQSLYENAKTKQYTYFR